MAQWQIDKEELIGWRRHLHQHPEIAWEEKETAHYLAEQLRKMGVKEVAEEVFGYGLVATIPGDPKKKCAALRGDMDALPIEEENNVPYRSLVPGKMHACGHDAHMAIVLGAVKALLCNPPQGSIKVIFQPREEKTAGRRLLYGRAGRIWKTHKWMAFLVSIFLLYFRLVPLVIELGA